MYISSTQVVFKKKILPNPIIWLCHIILSPNLTHYEPSFDQSHLQLLIYSSAGASFRRFPSPTRLIAWLMPTFDFMSNVLSCNLTHSKGNYCFIPTKTNHLFFFLCCLSYDFSFFFYPFRWLKLVLSTAPVTMNQMLPAVSSVWLNLRAGNQMMIHGEEEVHHPAVL